VIQVQNLTHRYGDRIALSGVSFDVKKGEIFGLLGPNGSGKTTTIKLLLGLLFPTDGDALVFNMPSGEVRKNERIGYLPEESYLYRFLNAEETLDFYGRLFNLDPAVRRDRSAKLIETVGLKNDKKRILKEYSKGMRQRIGLAQALINDPELVILDEPTSGLDPLGTRWMKDLIMKLRDDGKTIIMCSHRLEDVQDICDRVAILNEGELRKLDSVKNLLEDVLRLELRATGVQLNDDLKRDLEAALAKHGGKIEFIGHPTTTLEALFLRIIEESKAHPGRRYMPETKTEASALPADGKPADVADRHIKK
jgi:ABC-2 type transport system ATP-binding protein